MRDNEALQTFKRLEKELQLKALGVRKQYPQKSLKWVENYLHFHRLWNQRDIATIDLLFKARPYPSYIEIETTTRCPLRCSFCERSYWNEPSKDMSLENFKLIVDQFPDLKWIGLTGIGESFIRPKEFLEMIEYVKKKDVYVELYDSFLLINEDIAKRLIELGVDKIFASIDGATKETYEKVRVGSNYDKVWENVKTFDRLAKQEEGHYPELCFHYIVNRDNIHEVVSYLEKIKELNIKPFEIRFARMLHKFKEIEHLFMEVPSDVQTKIKQRARELNLPVTWNANLPHRKPPSFNCIEWYMPFIFWNGDVISCCAQNEGNRRDWQHSVAMGNIFKTPFKEIWENKYPKLIDDLRDGKYPEECKDCPIYEF